MEQAELEEARRAAGSQILSLRQSLLSTRILNKLGGAFRRGSPAYWVAGVVLLNLIILGPWLLLGAAYDGLERTRYLWVSGAVTVEFVIAGFLLAHIETRRMLEDIPALILPGMSEAGEIVDLGRWLAGSLSLRSMLPLVLPVWLVWVLLGAAGQSIVHRQFVGSGFALTVLLEGLLAAIALYSVFWISRVAYQLRRYRYELNRFSPDGSEIVHNITELIKRRAFAFSLYFFAFMLTSSSSLVDINSRLVFALPAFVLIWTVMITQYLITRSTTREIVERGKWKMLNKITAQINRIEETGDLSDRETAEKLLRLGEIHRQVLASRAGTVDWYSLTTLAGQLMLPILGLLIGNLDKVSGLLR